MKVPLPRQTDGNVAPEQPTETPTHRTLTIPAMRFSVHRFTRIRALLGAFNLDGIIFLLVFLVAAFVRLQGLWDAPPFEDEHGELLLGLETARGHALPSRGSDPYLGPLFSYLLAAGFWLAGPTETTARGVAALAGALSVALAFLVGRELYGRAAGLIGAALMIANPFLVLISRMVHSFSLSPPFFLLGVLFLLRYLKRRSPAAAVLAGLCLGAAVHAHPAGLPAVVATLIWAVVRCRPGLQSRWALIGLGTMLAVNLNFGYLLTPSGAAARAEIANRREGYAAAPGAQVGLSLDRLVTAAKEHYGLIFRLPGGRWRNQDFLADRWLQLFFALALVSLFWSARRGQTLPLAVALPVCLLSPLTLIRAEHYEARFVLPSFLLVFVAMGGMLAATSLGLTRRLAGMHRSWVARSPEHTTERPDTTYEPPRMLVLAVNIVVACLVVFQHHRELRAAHYGGVVAVQQWARELGSQIAAWTQPGEIVFLDPALPYRPKIALEVRLSMLGVPGRRAPERAPGPGLYVVASASELETELVGAGAVQLCCPGGGIQPAAPSPEWGRSGGGPRVYGLTESLQGIRPDGR